MDCYEHQMLGLRAVYVYVGADSHVQASEVLNRLKCHLRQG